MTDTRFADDVSARIRQATSDVDDLDGVVAVAEPVPRRDLGLDVAGRVGGPGAEGVASDVVGRPVE
jgi:hypothetical protein